MSKRLILLTQWFDPEPTFKGMVFAHELVQRGFEVEVITGFPNYPGGKLYPGYKVKWIQREFVDGVTITRVPLYPSHDRSSFRRILNYLSFAATSLFYGLFWAKRADVIYTYHPPLTVGLSAAIIRLFRRIPVVYDVQDMWPDTLRATGMINNPKALQVIEKFCQYVYRQVDRIVVLSPGFKQLLIERGVPEKKIAIIYNWADEVSLRTPTGQPHPEFADAQHVNILFAGNLGKAQALDTVIEAASRLRESNPHVRFLLLGDGIEKNRLEHRTKELGLQNIIFLPRVPMKEVGTALEQADALLVHLRRDPLFSITIPSKTQAYMAIGKPILMGVEGDAASLIHASSGGFTFSPEDPDSLVDAVHKLASLEKSQLQQIGDNAKRYYEAELSLSVGVENFCQLFDELTQQ